MNEAYTESIRASVRNSVFDDSYTYKFRISDGSLPDGITSYSLNRRYYFEGTPTEVGEFDFTLSVNISDNDDYYDDDSDAATCNDTAEQRLTFSVEEASE